LYNTYNNFHTNLVSIVRIVQDSQEFPYVLWVLYNTHKNFHMYCENFHNTFGVSHPWDKTNITKKNFFVLFSNK